MLPFSLDYDHLTMDSLNFRTMHSSNNALLGGGAQQVTVRQVTPKLVTLELVTKRLEKAKYLF